VLQQIINTEIEHTIIHMKTKTIPPVEVYYKLIQERS